MNLGGGYNFGNYDPRTGKEPSQIVGKQSVGNTSLKYLYDTEDVEASEDEEDEEIESTEPIKGMSSKISNSLPMTSTDFYSARNADNAAGQTKNTGGLNLVFEFSGHHKNVARKGISPFKQPKHSGPPLGGGGSGQAFRTTGNFVGIGTQYGSSRPHKLLRDDQEQKNRFSLMDLIKDTEPSLNAFKRQQNKVKKVLNDI